MDVPPAAVTAAHVETKSGVKLIDKLRAEIRAGMAAG